MMRNLTAALVREERIRTTRVKAMQLRPFVERLVTLAKNGDLHSRRLAFSRLGQKQTVHKLFEEIGPRVTSFRSLAREPMVRWSMLSAFFSSGTWEYWLIGSKD